ncbi:MAG: cupin domain-containing protein [Candidatus Aenigmatarchaeota archaeon]
MATIVDLGKAGKVTPEDAERIKSSVVILQPGQEVGEHITSDKEEVLIMLEGIATVMLRKEELTVGSGHAVYIPKSMPHNVINRSNTPLRYVYVVSLHK